MFKSFLTRTRNCYQNAIKFPHYQYSIQSTPDSVCTIRALNFSNNVSNNSIENKKQTGGMKDPEIIGLCLDLPLTKNTILTPFALHEITTSKLDLTSKYN